MRNVTSWNIEETTVRFMEIACQERVSSSVATDPNHILDQLLRREKIEDEALPVLAKRNRIRARVNSYNDYKNAEGRIALNKRRIRKPWKYRGFLFPEEWVIYYKQ